MRFLALLMIVAGAAAVEAPPRPNVIVILADDLGYECIGADGGTSYRTPELDRLAAGGVRFSRCNVQPLCTPTRVQLMTAQYNVRNYSTFGSMDPHAVTFAKLFQQAGYATCMAGKWQLGKDADLPKAFGFDEHCLWQLLRRPSRYANPGLEINGQERDYHHGEYGPDVVSDYALDFIARMKDRPFLLYYTMMLTHAPYPPTPDSKDWDPAARRESERSRPGHFKDMVEYMDKLVAKLTAKLDELHLRERTLIVFLGDNGTGKGVESKMGERRVDGGKGQTTEYGTHVPLIVDWPGTVRKGAVCDDLVDATDLLPTLCDAAKVPIPATLTLDGRSFWPQCIGAKASPRDWWYCWYAPYDDLIGEFAATASTKLYRDGRVFDLVADPGEQHPLDRGKLSAAAAADVEKLQQALDRYAHARPPELQAAPSGKRKSGED